MTHSATTNLDAFLRDAGEDAILRRGTTDVTVRVREDISGENTLTNDISQFSRRFILSPTQIIAAGWPAQAQTGTAPFNPDVQMPRVGDRLIWQGRAYHIDRSSPRRIGAEVVRIEILVMGGAQAG